MNSLWCAIRFFVLIVLVLAFPEQFLPYLQDQASPSTSQNGSESAAFGLEGRVRSLVSGLRSPPTRQHLVGVVHGHDSEFVEPLRRLGVQVVRVDQLFDILIRVERNEQGDLICDWTALDEALTNIRAMGAEPFVGLDFTPTPLSSKPYLDNQRRRITPPIDYGEWEELVYGTVKHVNQSSKQRVIYWEVWNEPDFAGFWEAQPQKYTRWATGARDADLWTPGRDAQAAAGEFRDRARFLDYLKLYEHAASAVVRADSTAKIGGPSLAGFNPRWLKGFIHHCAERRIRLDFLSWHYPRSPKAVREAVASLGAWLKPYPQLHPEFVISEWSVDRWAGGDKSQEAQFAVEMIQAFQEAGISIAIYYAAGSLFDDGQPNALYKALQDWVGDKGNDRP